MKVLVNGIGNIGKTILGILCDYKSKLNIDEIYALKNTAITDWNKEELNILSDMGIVICSRENEDYLDLEDIIDRIDYVFDCNANGFGLKNKYWYENLTSLKGCSAQGSEKGFGIPFMTGINDEQIEDKKFVQIVSCNTHALSSIITTFVNDDLSNLIEGDFVIVRRSEDIGNHERLVTSNVLSRHLKEEIGTHHAIDVKDLFLTKDEGLNIQSSDITTPSQLMHSVRFNLYLKNSISISEIKKRIEDNEYISTSSKFDSNILFELGRRYSPYGRLFSHAIINDNNLLFDVDHLKVKGWAFIPQEGNTILSTIHAFLLQVNMNNTTDVMNAIKKDLVKPAW